MFRPLARQDGDRRLTEIRHLGQCGHGGQQRAQLTVEKGFIFVAGGEPGPRDQDFEVALLAENRRAQRIRPNRRFGAGAVAGFRSQADA